MDVKVLGHQLFFLLSRNSHLIPLSKSIAQSVSFPHSGRHVEEGWSLMMESYPGEHIVTAMDFITLLARYERGPHE